jgi:hypothetical protein
VTECLKCIDRDELHGLPQFQEGNAEFLHEDVMDCVASKCKLEGSEQGALDFLDLDLCLCSKVSKVLGGKWQHKGLPEAEEYEMGGSRVSEFECSVTYLRL